MKTPRLQVTGGKVRHFLPARHTQRRLSFVHVCSPVIFRSFIQSLQTSRRDRLLRNIFFKRSENRVHTEIPRERSNNVCEKYFRLQNFLFTTPNVNPLTNQQIKYRPSSSIWQIFSHLRHILLFLVPLSLNTSLTPYFFRIS